MNENEQIQEMARLMEEPCVGSCKACEYYLPKCDISCMNLRRAKIIYSKDYRKVERGEWERVGKNRFRCTACKSVLYLFAKFCPECGADMRGDRDDQA